MGPQTNPQHLSIQTLGARCPQWDRDVGRVHMQTEDGASVLTGWRNTNDLP